MNKIIPLLFGILILGTNNGTVDASSNDAPPSIEETFVEAGYISVEEAVNEFEDYFKYDVNLPKTMPNISFTHQFGRFDEDREYNMNNELRIIFVNEDLKENIFKIDIRPLKNKLGFEGKEYKLQDGTRGVYFESHLFNFFVFEKSQLQYMLGIGKEVSNTKTPEVLVDIANSIH